MLAAWNSCGAKCGPERDGERVLENAGAEAGSLVLEAEGQYLVRASKATTATEPTVLTVPLTSRPEAGSRNGPMFPPSCPVCIE